jgi:hypothetical protein
MKQLPDTDVITVALPAEQKNKKTQAGDLRKRQRSAKHPCKPTVAKRPRSERAKLTPRQREGETAHHITTERPKMAKLHTDTTTERPKRQNYSPHHDTETKTAKLLTTPRQRAKNGKTTHRHHDVVGVVKRRETKKRAGHVAQQTVGSAALASLLIDDDEPSEQFALHVRALAMPYSNPLQFQLPTAPLPVIFPLQIPRSHSRIPLPLPLPLPLPTPLVPLAHPQPPPPPSPPKPQSVKNLPAPVRPNHTNS